jgi:hypothetical protein
VHKSLQTSPAIAAGISDRLWSMEDLVCLTDQHVVLELAIQKRLRVDADDA